MITLGKSRPVPPALTDWRSDPRVITMTGLVAEASARTGTLGHALAAAKAVLPGSPDSHAARVAAVLGNAAGRPRVTIRQAVAEVERLAGELSDADADLAAARDALGTVVSAAQGVSRSAVRQAYAAGLVELEAALDAARVANERLAQLYFAAEAHDVAGLPELWWPELGLSGDAALRGLFEETRLTAWRRDVAAARRGTLAGTRS